VTRVDDGELHHAAWVRDLDNGEYRLYVDGELDATGPIGPQVVGQFRYEGDDPLIIGAWYGFGGSVGQLFEGLIDEVSIYDAALDDADVRAIYAAGAAGKCLP